MPILPYLIAISIISSLSFFMCIPLSVRLIPFLFVLTFPCPCFVFTWLFAYLDIYCIFLPHRLHCHISFSAPYVALSFTTFAVFTGIPWLSVNLLLIHPVIFLTSFNCVFPYSIRWRKYSLCFPSSFHYQCIERNYCIVFWKICDIRNNSAVGISVALFGSERFGCESCAQVASHISHVNLVCSLLFHNGYLVN